MKELVFVNNNNEVVTDSLMVAEVFGRRHHDVIRSIVKIQNELEEIGDFEGIRNFSYTSYDDSQNKQKYNKYNLTKDGFTLLVMGFTGSEALKFKTMYIKEFNRMEEELNGLTPKLPGTYLEALESLVESEKSRLELSHKVEEDRPKVEYHDRVLESESTYTATQIANEFQMSAIKLNRLLIDSGVLRRVSGQLVVRAKYQGEDYTDTKTYEFNEGRTSQQLRWTERGRAFIHTLLKGTGLGIL